MFVENMACTNTIMAGLHIQLSRNARSHETVLHWYILHRLQSQIVYVNCVCLPIMHIQLKNNSEKPSRARKEATIESRHVAADEWQSGQQCLHFYHLVKTNHCQHAITEDRLKISWSIFAQAAEELANGPWKWNVIVEQVRYGVHIACKPTTVAT